MQSSLSSLWVGDLPNEASEQYVRHIFSTVGQEIISVKLIRDKITLQPAGYGFIEFKTPEIAENVLKNFADKPIAGMPGKYYRLNWSGNLGTTAAPIYKPSSGESYSIWVGDLDPNVNDSLLETTMRAKYPSVQSARIVLDPLTGRSKGFGFVKFGVEIESKAAIAQMQGTFILSRPIRLNSASRSNQVDVTPVATTATVTTFSMLTASGTAAPVTKPQQPFYPMPELSTDPNNNTIYVGNIDGSVTEEKLRSLFEPFGPLQSIKLPPGKGCAFVQFLYYQHANGAVQHLHGAEIGASRMRLSWGNAAMLKQPTMMDQIMSMGAFGLPIPLGFDPSMYGPGYGLNPQIIHTAPAVESVYVPPPEDPSTVIDTSYLNAREMTIEERNVHFIAAKLPSLMVDFTLLAPGDKIKKSSKSTMAHSLKYHNNKRPTPALAPLVRVKSTSSGGFMIAHNATDTHHATNILSPSDLGSLNLVNITPFSSSHLDKRLSQEFKGEDVCVGCGQKKMLRLTPAALEPKKKPWRKILYERQPYDDNYIPDSFLSSAIMNANVQPYTYWKALNDTLDITNQLTATAVFYVVFSLVANNQIDSIGLLAIDASIFLVGFLVWSVIRYQNNRNDLITSLTKGESLKPEEVFKRQESRPPVIVENEYYVPAFTPLDRKPQLSVVDSLFSNFRMLTRVFVFISVLHTLSPILQTLTMAFSSDTISALSIFFFSLHLFLFDYDAVSSTHPDFTGTISLNAAIFTSVLLASRLQSSLHVYAFVCYAFETFALLPIFLVTFRRWSGVGYISWGLSFLFILIGFISLLCVSVALSLAFIAIISFVTFACPAIIIYNQRFKNQIQGPWDYDDSKELDEL